MASNPIVKLKRGTRTALNSYPTIDGQLYFATASEDALSASTAANDTSYNIFVLDQESGNSVVRTNLDAYKAFYAKQAGTAATAAKWSTKRSFKVADSNSHNGTAVDVDGSAAVTLTLPSTIQATIIGNVTGNVTGTADAAKKLVDGSGSDYSVGSSTKPVYFLNGIPTEVTSVDVAATSASKWSTARSFIIRDADATNTGTGVAVDGSTTNMTSISGTNYYVLKLPSTIKATLTGNASTATKATKLYSSSATDGLDVGNAKLPVYFSGGVPVACNDVNAGSGTALTVNISGTAAKASALTTGYGSNSSPVYIQSSGVPAAVTSIPASLLTGTIDIDRLPKGALERLVTVSTETDMAALSASSDPAVEIGDTVRAADTSKMYYVVAKTTNGSGISGAIVGTNYEFIPYAAGTAVNATSATTAATLANTRTFSIAGGATAAAQNFNGSQNVTLTVTALDVDKASAGTLAVARGGTGKATWTQYGIVYASATDTLAQLGVGTDGYVLKSNGSAAPSWTAQSNIAAGTAAKLATKRAINGTDFDGSAAITTASWGTARNVYISDSDATNTGAAVSVGSATSGSYTLKLPATIKASLSGNATTATTADTLKYKLTINHKNVNGDTTDSTDYGQGTANATFSVNVDKLFLKYTATYGGSAVVAGNNTWYTITPATALTTGTYIVQISTGNISGIFDYEVFSGIMSFCSDNGTSGAVDTDEVLLHAAGRNSYGHRLYLRTRRVASGAMIIEFQSDVALTQAQAQGLSFTFRRMI